MALEIGLRHFEAKESIVGKLVRAYIITKESDGSVKFDEFFVDMTNPFRAEDFFSRLRGCYSCLRSVAPDAPLLLKDDVGTNCSFHDLCLYQECLVRLDDRYVLKPS